MKSQASDKEIITHFKALCRKERELQSEWLKELAVLDSRKLYCAEGYSSLFAFLTQALNYSESSAAKRIQVMRTCETFPTLYALIAQSQLSMNVVSRIAPILSEENFEKVVSETRGKSVRHAEWVVACHRPKPVPEDSVRKLPQKRVEVEAAPAPLPLLAPTPPERKPTQVQEPLTETATLYKFSADPEFTQLFEKLYAAARQREPGLSMGEFFKKTLRAYEQKTDRTKALERPGHRSQGPAHHTRSIPREIQRTVWQRDAGQCAYTAPSGHRCQTRINLQFDHIQPWAMGGSSHTSTNIRLLCPAHNRWRAPAMRSQRREVTRFSC